MPAVSLDVLAVIRAPLEGYPPSLHQVGILAEAGLSVGVADCNHPGYREIHFSGPHPVRRFHLTRHTDFFKESPPPVLIRLYRTLAFKFRVARLIRTYKPKVVIAYDPHAMFAVGPLWDRPSAPKLIWHYHELNLPADKTGGQLTRDALSFACQNAARADAVVMPDAGRAEMFKEKTGLSLTPRIVMNCPRRLDQVPDPMLDDKLPATSEPNDQIVYFQGCIGPSRCFEAVIKSMPSWPESAIFVLVGPVQEDYQNSLLKLADSLGMKNRLVFLGRVPYETLNPLAAGATVGISIVSGFESSANWNLTAGAVNKRFEYMAVGIPQVSNTGPGMKEIVSDTETGTLVDPADSNAIGRAISELLIEREKAARFGENGRKAHLDRFCYEAQFSDLLVSIASWAGKELPRAS